MEVIKTGTNIATVKISELPQTTDTAGRSTLATNADNDSEALELTQISEAIDAAAIAQQAATEAKEAAKDANTLAGVARTAASNAEAAAEDAQTARNSAETAATEAKEAAEGISQDLTGKADLDANKKYLLATQLDPKTGYQTAAIMGKGWFSSENEALCLKDKDQTIILTFVTGNKAGGTSNVVYREFSNYDLSAAVYIQYTYSTKQLAGLVRGSLTLNRTVQPNTLVSAALSYHSDGRCVWFLNGVQVYNNTPPSLGVHNPTRAEIGGGQDVCVTDNKIISLRKFDFAMTTEQLEEAWNNGHPELWRVPDEFRAHEIVWPIDNVAESQNVFLGNNPSQITTTQNVPQENGFSGAFQRFAGASQAPSVYCNLWIYKYNRAPIRLTIEYRSTSDLYSDTALTKLLLPANTGDAKTVTLDVIDGVYGGAIYAKTTDDTFEIRTIKAEEIGCILDLNAHGLLPTVWRDTSGHGNDLPYSPSSGNPDTCELSYERHGFEEVIIGTAAPTATPDFIGQKFIDTTNKVTYTAYGTTSAGDWE